MRTLCLALPLISACATSRAFLPTDPSFQPSPRAFPVDVYLLQTPSAPYRIVGTLRVEADPDDDAIEVQHLALVEAARVGCELLIAPQLISRLDLPFPFVLAHGGEHGGGAAAGSGAGAGAGPTPGAGRDLASRRVIHEFGCGLYRLDKITDA